MNARRWTRSWLARGLPLAAALALAAVPAPAATVLTDAQLTSTPDGGAVLRLTGDGGFEPRHFLLDEPFRVVLDLLGTADPVGVSLKPDGGFVRAVRCAARPEREGRPVVRYVVETSGAPVYRVESSNGELRLSILPAPEIQPAGKAAQAALAAEPAPAGGVASSAERPAQAELPVAAPVPSPAPAESAAPAAAGTPAPPAVAAPPAPPQMAAEKPAPPAPLLGAAAPARMSLDVQEANILTVLRSISDYAGINVVADANVQGSVTIRALDLPWPEMLASVCRALSLEAIDTGAVIRVATQKTAREEELARETAARKQEEFLPLFTRIIPVNYANAAELQETLNKMVGARGIIEVDKRTNALVVTDIAPRLDEIAGLVRRLDSETVQVEIEARIVDVDATQARQLGISWSLDGLHSAAAGASGSVRARSSEILDASGQVRVGVIRSFGALDAQLQALEQSNQAEIISTPRITTVNNRMARILVGKEVPLITLDYAGNAITELKKVGIALEVTPHINIDGQITMDLHPEVSDLSSQSTVAGGVVFTTTEADTRVLVRDGQTAVIAGLIRSGETSFERGIPLLKDLPLLGAIFKSSDKRVEKRELLIFITPRIVPPGRG
ncbi:MAG: type IV pilus secretin PilQ [Candidatus Eisenbacteria bacterium]|uniref:Type IV pilus secretin PilQ n=1 Tax=Eiseniibacteriota bacterium TaxID=2212470 RepID=A0A937X7B0_UNCEI|nr:type IV pilus secretin PilQ [Candidatus Eisenbacteria bacterium]